MNSIDKDEVQRLLDTGSRSALFTLILKYDWSKECMDILSKELDSYKEDEDE